MSEFPQAAQFGNVALSLLLIVVLIVACVWLLKRIAQFNQGTAGKLRVLASLSIGTRERALLVQAGDTQMLLGVAPGRVSTLHVFDEPVIVADDNKAANVDFASQLAGLLPVRKS